MQKTFISLIIILLLAVSAGCQKKEDVKLPAGESSRSQMQASPNSASQTGTPPSEDHVKNALGQMIPEMMILRIQGSPVAGLWEVAFESQGKKGILYLDSSLNYVFAGNIFSTQTRVNLTQESFAQFNKVDTSLIPYEKALVLGDKKAPIRVAVFDDVD